MGPKHPCSAVLSPEEEATIVAVQPEGFNGYGGRKPSK